MAKKYDLSCLEKREILNEAASSAEVLLSWGEHYEEVGSLHDAVDFYEKADARDHLFRVLRRAQDTGNFFLFRRICRILGHDPNSDEWLQLASRARELGKAAFAEEANRLGGRMDSPDELAH